MTQPNASDPGNLKEVKLPRRDWILLPALSLLTICLVLISIRLIARRMFAGFGAIQDCLVFDDPSTGARGIPNCVCLEKIPEGEVTEYRFNSCGHRAGMECGPKPPGVYLIVMVGSSVAMGARVPRDKTLAALLPSELSLRTGSKIELYNEGIPLKTPQLIALHFDQALAVKPDMILWILTPFDIRDQLPGLPQHRSALAPKSRLSLYVKARQILEAATNRAQISTIGFLLRHFLYESQSQYISSYLMNDRDTPHIGQDVGPTEYLMEEPSAEWRKLLLRIDTDTAEMEARARAAGVPLVAVLLPERVQAAMVSKGEWPAGFDPYKLNNELRSIVMNHGATYVDIFPDLRNIPNPEQGYFPIDGHLDARGHAMISELLANELTNGVVPALKTAQRPGMAMQRGR